MKKQTAIGKWIKNYKNTTVSEKITRLIFFIFFFVMSLVFLYPIYSAVLMSFTRGANSSYKEITSFADFFRVGGEPQFDSWRDVFTDFSIPNDYGDQNFFDMLFNSLWFTVGKTGLSLLCSAILAYAVAKFNFPGKNLIFFMVIFVQTIPLFGSGGATIKLLVQFDMLDNPSLFWICWCTGFDFTFLIMHGAFTGISNSYSEAANIDGANNWVILFKIIVPMVAPILLALFISNSLGVWNDYSTFMVYLTSYPNLSYGLYCYQLDQYGANTMAIQSAATIIAAMPIIIIYACSQKLILTNISIGGLKG